MRQFFYTCIFLFGCTTIEAQVLDADPDSLFQVGAYRLAALTYEARAFSEQNSQLSNKLLFKKANCYKSVGDYELSLSTLERISPRDVSLKEKVGYENSLMYFLTDKYQLSYSELLKLKLISKMPPESYQQLEILNLFALDKWAEARSLIETDTSISSEELATIFSGKIKYKDPDKAYRISMFLPGLGQMYAGHFFKGLVSSGVQAGLVGFSAFSIYNGYFWTGGMTGVAMFYTFYMGGARYAKNLAIRHNEEVSRQLSQRFLEIE